MSLLGRSLTCLTLLVTYGKCFDTSFEAQYQPHTSSNLVLRSSIPYPPSYYNNEYTQAWQARYAQTAAKRAQSWPITPQLSSFNQMSFLPQVPNWYTAMNVNPRPTLPNYNAINRQMIAQQQHLRAVQPQLSPQPLVMQQPWNIRQDVMQPAPAPIETAPVQPEQLAPEPAPQVDVGVYRHSVCEQCNGDCSNYLCYGCGGCQEPPPERQTYYYPYQRKDAAYHDAFKGNEMALSGLVIYPVPKILKSWTQKQKKTSSTRSNLKSKDFGDDDDDDDNDDDDAGDDDDDDDDDKQVKQTKKSKIIHKRDYDEPSDIMNNISY